MYICFCHAVTDSQATSLIQGGCTSVSGVYKRLGCRPQCGKCIPILRRLIDETRPLSEPAPIAAG